MIIDYFPYFDPYGKELLELRIRMLENYVDEFIICESNKTQSGIPIEYNLKKRIKELNLPQNKIKVIELNIPKDEDLTIEEIDILNCYENNKSNINSLRSRVRERLQKDALLQVLGDYDDDTLFIHSDSDEIINPLSLPWICDIVKQNLDMIIKIPLIYLEGRADLRVYEKETNSPFPWYGMFLCTKKQLGIATPSQIRGQVLCPFPIVLPTQNGEIAQDLGWHFSWMGGKESMLIKNKSFTHYDDSFSYLKYGSYKSEENQTHLNNIILEENYPPPSNLKNAILKKYPLENLPSEVFTLENVNKFLFPL